MAYLFHNRTDAGKRLAEALKKYEGTESLILGIPRGGVEPAFQAARILALELSVLIVRKLPFPDSPESGFGAIAEDGSLYIINTNTWMLEKNVVDRVIQQQKAELNRRVEILRGGRIHFVDSRLAHLVSRDKHIPYFTGAGSGIQCLPLPWLDKSFTGRF
jgi:predicted phosphoribosyltransferase